MEKKILGVSALCFALVGVTALAGALIDDEGSRKIVVIGGCIVVVLLTILNFKYVKEMKRMSGGKTEPSKDDDLLSMEELARWLQSETWAEIMSEPRILKYYPEELQHFRQSCTEPTRIKGFRIWRSEENEKYFDPDDERSESILVLMNMSDGYVEVHHSKILYQELMLRLK